jgi:hypothetical protein
VQQSKADINLLKNSGAENEGMLEEGYNWHPCQKNPYRNTVPIAPSASAMNPSVDTNIVFI